MKKICRIHFDSGTEQIIGSIAFLAIAMLGMYNIIFQDDILFFKNNPTFNDIFSWFLTFIGLLCLWVVNYVWMLGDITADFEKDILTFIYPETFIYLDENSERKKTERKDRGRIRYVLSDVKKLEVKYDEFYMYVIIYFKNGESIEHSYRFSKIYYGFFSSNTPRVKSAKRGVYRLNCMLEKRDNVNLYSV